MSTSGPVVEEPGISRSIIYQILEKLVEKGLVSYVTKDKTKYFQASQPDKILEYIKNKEEKLKENKIKVEKLLPDLNAIQKSAKKSEVSIYFGLKGIRAAYEHLYLKLKKGEDFYFLGIPPSEPEEQDIYWEKDQHRMTKAGIKCKLLFHQGTPKEIIKDRNSYKWCEAREMISLNLLQCL